MDKSQDEAAQRRTDALGLDPWHVPTAPASVALELYLAILALQTVIEKPCNAEAIATNALALINAGRQAHRDATATRSE